MDSDVKNSDVVFDSIADGLRRISHVIQGKMEQGEDLPSLEDVEKMWEDLNKKLSDLDELKKADFCIKKHNEFYFITAFLRARKLSSRSASDSIIYGLTQAEAGGADGSFIRKDWKELKRKMEQ